MKKRGTRRGTAHTVTFGDSVDSLVLALAKIRGGNKLIAKRVRERTGRILSENQITYRLSKGQKLEGRKGGYRVGFSNGTSPEYLRIEADYLSIFQAEIQRTLPQKINHPTPKIVKLNEPKPPTVLQVINALQAETAEQRRERLEKLKARYKEAEGGGK